MATHSSILAWWIPWTEEPGGLQSTGSHRVRHDWSDLALNITSSCCIGFIMKLKKWDDLSLLPSRIGPIPASFPLSLPVCVCVCVCVCLTVSLSVLLLLSLPPSVVHKLRILLRRCTPTTLYSSYQTGKVWRCEELAWKCLWWKVNESVQLWSYRWKENFLLFFSLLSQEVSMWSTLDH